MLREDVADFDLPMIRNRTGGQIRNPRLVRIADHQRHAGERGNLLGRPLRVASCHQDARQRMLAMDTPHRLPDFVVGRCGNRAGIEHDQFGFAGPGGGRESFRREAGFNRGSVGLRGAASEVLDPKAVHYVECTRNSPTRAQSIRRR